MMAFTRQIIFQLPPIAARATTALAEIFIIAIFTLLQNEHRIDHDRYVLRPQ